MKGLVGNLLFKRFLPGEMLIKSGNLATRAGLEGEVDQVHGNKDAVSVPAFVLHGMVSPAEWSPRFE